MNFKKLSQGERIACMASLLDRISPDCGYSDWLVALMVVFTETHGGDDGFELVDRWSSKGQTYKGRRDVEKYWNRFSLNHKKPLRIGSLIRLANSR
jgi:hypothetical protein